MVNADATEEDSLTRAGIERARGLLTTLGTDAANLYVTLTARQMKPGIAIAAAAMNQWAVAKLKAAGADRVVSPYELGGSWMAQLILSPTVADFMEVATGANPLDLFMEQQGVDAASSLCGQSLANSDIGRDLGVIVVAVQKPDGQMVTNPRPDTIRATPLSAWEHEEIWPVWRHSLNRRVLLGREISRMLDLRPYRPG